MFLKYFVAIAAYGVLRNEPVFLRMTHAELSLIFHRLPIAVTYYDMSFRLRYANPEFLRGWRLAESDILGKEFTAFLSKFSIAYIDTHIRRAAAGETVKAHRLRDEGTQFALWIENHFHPVFSENGEIDGILIYSFDIDRFKRAELDYSALKIISEKTPNAWAYIGADGRYEYANNAYLAMGGWHKSEIIGKPWDHVLDAESVAASRAQVEKALRGETEQSVGYPTSERIRIDHRLGHARWVRRTIVPHLDDLTRKVHGVYVVAEDIHELKSAEHQLQTANLHLNSHLDQSLIAVIEWVEQDGILWAIRCSSKAVEMFGSRVSQLGFSFREIEGRDSDAHTAEHLKSIVSGETSSTHFQCRNLNAEGNVIHCEWHFSAICENDGAISSVMAFAQDITNQVRAERELRRIANIDALTGLPNRWALENHINQAIARARQTVGSVAVIFFDLDRFKNVNDTLGHNAGDALLIAIAQRVRGIVRDSDLIARQGGDEFLMVLSNVLNVTEATSAAARFLESVSKPFEIEGQVLHVEASAGIAVFPRDGNDADSLFRAADTAMYAAKASGRNRVVVYEPILGAQQIRAVELEAALRNALAAKKITVNFQPCSDINDGRMIGVEALARWQLADGEWVSPERFIPLAEQTGLIHQLGVQVLEQAASFAATTEHLKVAVNVSVVQLIEPTFLETVRGILRRTSCLPAKLELELTESAEISGAEIIATVNTLANDIGIGIAIDDFGTGYSNLANLRRLPIQTLKIDRGFVAELETSGDAVAIVRATIALAHSLGLNVVAEGVETLGQRHILKQMHCDAFQGYLVSPAMPAGDLMERIARDAARSGLPAVSSHRA